MSEQAIGLFDSGLGGLTVFDAIRKELPRESIDYFGDTARVPYGCKSQSTITSYAKEISAFLLKRNIKALVIACNTASAYALEALQEELSIPVMGVIHPGAKRAVQISQNKHIGVIGTKATIQSGVYERSIHNLEKEMNITSYACPLFVPLIEENMIDHPATQLIVKEALDPFEKAEVDTLLLGCTHYPHLIKVIEKNVHHKIQLIDSASCCAEALHELLEEKKIKKRTEKDGTYHFFVTDDPEFFRESGSQFLGYPLSSVERVRL